MTATKSKTRRPARTRSRRASDLFEELIIDSFAGGGGASLGIERALGRAVDVAINHDRASIDMHQANHPHTPRRTSACLHPYRCEYLDICHNGLGAAQAGQDRIALLRRAGEVPHLGYVKKDDRWDAGGGDSVTRYQSATRSLIAWRRVLHRATVHCGDAFDFISSVKDDEGRGLYVDAPWPEQGDCYRHPFDETKQRQLAKDLGRYASARIVIRFGDHPLIRELYPEANWLWVMQAGRAQSNERINEVLIINGKSYGKGALCN